MNKKYSQTIVEMLKEDTKNSAGKRELLMMFLSRKGEIESAIAYGWTVKSIWQTLHCRGLFSGKYDCFARYVRLYIKQKSPIKEEVPTQTNVSPQPIKPTDTSKPKPDSNPSPPRFEYNPNVTLDINDL